MATRLSVNVNDETATALRTLAEDKSTSVTDVFHRAVSVYKFFRDSEADGRAIQFAHPDGTVTRVQMI